MTKTSLAIRATLFLFLLFSAEFFYAQCAGNDIEVTICNKDQDTAYQTFDLSTLIGTHEAGGTWTAQDPANFFALNTDTGIINLWRVNKFGEHIFTYTVASGSCTDTATVTLNLGGYPGEDNTDGSANVCSDNTQVNLHNFLGSQTPGKVQDVNGIWAEVPNDATGALTDNIFNANIAGPGTYTFTYTVDAVETCPSRQSTVILEVFRAPEAGTPIPVSVCASDDLSSQTHIDLHDLLEDEDSFGSWSEDGTSQLSGPSDSIINIEEIRDNHGQGTYNFTYTVPPNHPTCTEDIAVVSISIEPALIGSLNISNLCSTDTAEITINYNTSSLTDGQYQLRYTLEVGGQPTTMQEIITLQGGTGTLPFAPSTIVGGGIVTVTINEIWRVTNVEQTPTGPEYTLEEITCSIAVPSETFIVYDPGTTIDDICPDENASVVLTHILDTTGNPLVGGHTINYTLTKEGEAPSNHSQSTIDFTDGQANLSIPFAQLSGRGTYTVSLDIQGALALGCDISDSFQLFELEADISMDLAIDDLCNTTTIEVQIEGPALSDGDYTITYEITEFGTSTVISDGGIEFNGGNLVEDIDISTLETGNYTLTVSSTQNNTSPCRSQFNFETSQDFAIGGSPEVPEGPAAQYFCIPAMAPSVPTLQNLDVSASGNLLFFSSATDTTPLPLTTELVHGEDYFAASENPAVASCGISERLRILTYLEDPPAPNSSQTTPEFCASWEATLANLNVTVPSDYTVEWFNTASGGTPLSLDTPLVNGESYFAATTTVNQCSSTIRLEFVPTIHEVDEASLQHTTLDLCTIDNPTVESLIALEMEGSPSILWYEAPEGGTPLANNHPLEERTYYAESYDSHTDCANVLRVAVMVRLDNCPPEQYDFFIPNAFTPNGDGRNDEFYVPNIEHIFPDFTLEILNRYGNTLFKGNKTNPRWDGSNNGNGIAPNGVYFFILDYHSDQHNPVQGTIYLNR